MVRQLLFIILPVIILSFPLSSANADSYIVKLEYFRTGNPIIVSLVKAKEAEYGEKRQLIYDDLDQADGSSRRTLISLLDILDWYQNKEYRRLIKQGTMIFSNEFTVRERDSGSFEKDTSYGILNAFISAGKKRRRGIPLAFTIYLNGIQVFSQDLKVYPLDRLILLQESFQSGEDPDDLQMLFMEVRKCSPLVCKEEDNE